MTKWYEVKITTIKVVAIELADDAPKDDAAMVAMAEAIPFDGDSEAEVTGGPYISGDVLESVKRHADEVLPL